MSFAAWTHGREKSTRCIVFVSNIFYFKILFHNFFIKREVYLREDSRPKTVVMRATDVSFTLTTIPVFAFLECIIPYKVLCPTFTLRSMTTAQTPYDQVDDKGKNLRPRASHDQVRACKQVGRGKPHTTFMRALPQFTIQYTIFILLLLQLCVIHYYPFSFDCCLCLLFSFAIVYGFSCQMVNLLSSAKNWLPFAS